MRKVIFILYIFFLCVNIAGAYPSLYSTALSPDGTVKYVTDGYILDVVNTESNEVITSLNGPGVGWILTSIIFSPDGSTLYAVDSGFWRLFFIDTKTNTVIKEISLREWPFGIVMTPIGDKIYVCCEDSRSIAVIDTASQNVKKFITLESPNYNLPHAMSLSSDGKLLYVNSYSDDFSWTIDTTKDEVSVGNIPEFPTVIAPIAAILGLLFVFGRKKM